MSANEELDIGQARPEETDDVLRIMCEAFRMEFDVARSIYYSDPYFQIENKMVARLAGQVVSCLTIVERECWIGAATIKLAGIAGVATASHYRRQGFAGRLLQDTVGELTRRGFHLAALYPEDRSFYRRYGWEAAGIQTVVRGPFVQPLEAADIHVRAAGESDIPVLSRIYTRAATGRTLHCLRDEKRWRYLLQYVPGAQVALGADGNVAGYALYESRVTELEPKAEGCESETDRSVRLLEMYAECPDAVTALRRHLAGLGAHVEVQYSALPSVLAQNGFAETDAPHPALMARIIDWHGLIRILARTWPAPANAVGLVLTDPLCEPSTKAALITGRADGAEVEFVDPSDFPRRCDQFLVGDVKVWSAVAVGHLSAREACGLGVLKASSASAVDAACPLFPARDPFIPTADHF